MVEEEILRLSLADDKVDNLVDCSSVLDCWFVAIGIGGSGDALEEEEVQMLCHGYKMV